MDPQARFGTIQVEGRAEEHGERLSGLVYQFPDFDRVRLPDLPALIDGYEAKRDAIDAYLHLGYSLIRGTFDWYMISHRYRDERYFSA